MFSLTRSTFSSIIIRAALTMAAIITGTLLIIPKATTSKAFIESNLKDEALGDSSVLRFSETRGQSIATYGASGRVIDAVTGQPLAGIHVVYGRPANNTNNGGFVSFATAQTNTLVVEGETLPVGARILASITNQLRFSNGYAQVDEDGRFVISGLAAGTYEITLNVYHPPPRQAVRLLPTLKQIVKVTDGNESVVAFTIHLPAND
jgi:hypothetical protein